MNVRPLAFPGNLRPKAIRRVRRVRRRLLATAVLLPLLTFGLLKWRVDSVVVSSCPGLPEEARLSLGAYSGTPILLLSLHELRRLADVWPGVDAVEARLELPGRLVVTVHPSEVAGSRATGHGWHAVGADGAPGRRLEGPVPPVLERFPARQARLREGLAIAGRLEEETGRRVLGVRLVLPDDVEVKLAGDGAGAMGAVVHVTPAGSRAESWFTARILHGGVPGRWADLRSNHRAVVGGRG